MTNLITYKKCCFCKRALQKKEELQFVRKIKTINETVYLCQDCLLDAVIFIENFMKEDSAINAICNYIVKLKTGAHGIAQYLNQIFAPALEKIEDDLDDYKIEYETCIISEETIKYNNLFKLLPKQKNVNKKIK